MIASLDLNRPLTWKYREPSKSHDHFAISSRFDGGLGGFNLPSKIFDPSVTRLKHFTITDKLTSQPLLKC